MFIATTEITITSILLSTIMPVLFGVLGYFLTSFWINPVIEFRKLKERVVSDLIFYADILHAPGEENPKVSKTSEALRRHAADLRAINNTLIKNSMFRALMRAPKSDLIEDASSQLVGMSNSVYRRMDNSGHKEVVLYTRIKKVQDNLQILAYKDIEKTLELAQEICETTTK